MDEAMTKGVQFFFLKEGITKDQWHNITHDPHNGKKSYFEFIKEMVDAGVLQHYNQERGILPLDLETQILPSSAPSSFAQTIPPVASKRFIA